MNGLRSLYKSPLARASALMFSTIVGAGVLSIPYVVARVGVIVGGLYILGMGLLMLSIHILIGELVIATRKHVQLTGIARIYLGPTGAWLMAVVFMALHMGAMVAYLIGSGQSLAALIGGPSYIWTGLFFVIGAMIVISGARIISKFDYWMSLITITVIGIIVIVNTRFAEVVPVLPDSLSSLILPYGVLLFAFHGTSAISEMEVITGRDPKLLHRAIVYGTAGPMIVYLLFGITTVLVTGRETSEVATIGLGRAIGPAMVIACNLFAILAMSTSFVTIGQALRRTFQWDFGMRPVIAITLALGVPLLIFLVGARQFIQVIALVGGVFGTTEIILLLCAYWRLKHPKLVSKNKRA